MMTALIGAEIDGEQLTDEEVLGFCLLLVLAGNDTTSSLIGTGIVMLARDPEQRALLVNDPSLWPAAIEELNRIESPTQVLPRTAMKDAEFHGVTIPTGSRVMLVWGSANHDDREFPDPERLDVTRNVTRHLAFGHGAHYCLGANLARLEARVAFEEWHARFPHYQLSGGADPCGLHLGARVQPCARSDLLSRCPCSVLIVGGGIAGLSLATALRQRSIDCEIVERDAEWTTVGAGIALYPNGLRALARARARSRGRRRRDADRPRAHAHCERGRDQRVPGRGLGGCRSHRRDPPRPAAGGAARRDSRFAGAYGHDGHRPHRMARRSRGRVLRRDAWSLRPRRRRRRHPLADSRDRASMPRHRGTWGRCTGGCQWLPRWSTRPR